MKKSLSVSDQRAWDLNSMTRDEIRRKLRILPCDEYFEWLLDELERSRGQRRAAKILHFYDRLTRKLQNASKTMSYNSVQYRFT